MGAQRRPSTERLWVALFLGCVLSGFVLLLTQLFFLPLILIGPGGEAIAAALAAWVIFKGQQSLLDVFTRWQVPFAVIALTALPGLLVGVLAIRFGLGLVTAALPGCAIQALVLRLLAPRDSVGSAARAGAPATVPAPAALPVIAAATPQPAPGAEPEPSGLLADLSNPAARRPRD